MDLENNKLYMLGSDGLITLRERTPFEVACSHWHKIKVTDKLKHKQAWDSVWENMSPSIEEIAAQIEAEGTTDNG